MKSVRLAATIAASAAIAAACNLSAAATVPGLPRDLSAQDIARIEAFEEAHPLDIAGLGALVKEVSGQEMHVSVSGVPGTLSAREAQRIFDQRAALATKGSLTRTSPSIAAPMAVPLNAFTVAVSWIPVSSTQVKAHGVWNFRDDYVNGSDPDDYSSVALQLGCSRITGTTTITYDYLNNQTANSAYLYASGLSTGAPISGVRDRASGFKLLTDHGYTDVLVTRPSGCAAHTIGADYSFEHNQDGGSVFSVTAGWGNLQVNYNSVGSRLQMSTNPIYRWN